MATTQRHKDDEEEAQIPKTEFETSSEVESDKKAERSTTKLDKQAIPKNFFTLPEMIDYMKVNHGLPKTTVTNVFRELLTGRNGESYLRASQRRALQRSSNGTTSSTVGSSSSTK
ncbi:uncharacterized protein BNAA04G26580D isoform X2 [Brassica napus]|uniref:uncharacterized protein BNAA04G26580D isoform X2 n=1 Tax=Brassica napus TaxID=3708 RepID=UPI0006AA93B9|nr:uncharacterized protein BNAA04G26580D isoform X2 [Brassica napus]